MGERFAFPPVITASKWDTVYEAFWKNPPRGVVRDRNGTIAPKMTNREAMALVTGLRQHAPVIRDGFPLWYQFAATAYGWDPKTDRLNTTSAQADRVYDPDAAVELMLQMQRIMGDLDHERGGSLDPRLELDRQDFDDRLVQGDVIKALSEDGANAFIIPSCRDPKTGKKGHFPKRNPKTGKWECELEVTDPVADLRRGANVVAGIVIVLGLLYLMVPSALGGAIAGRVTKRRGRRTRRR